MNGGVTATHKLTVELEAQQWQMVRLAMGKAPYELVQPLLEAIDRQLQAQVQATEEKP